ncbi:daunorubicin/doxorubicin resistance ABC transporter ATP-binding protein DrrA [Spongiactinospora rosea]|uniref:Daunorubicin/doxorubicin resistance ABC transporter ATP-binding protein DrrA n=1 Tax=Spongiactinospora rosea TaxID=2248750 RepID=A0A366M227_9ACTN|nr:ATP-binding cassette domain-containing protein [Spongiactinospora rosea]RBQ20077.1 daunorubicin/doxorubicin resistance ABC transporter ATP-binding protein DrrA [Spongiactinospora rosea]
MSTRLNGAAIVAEGLWKRFGTTVALRGLDVEVPSGSVFGLLGPNGAGKTTLVRILSTLTRPDAGRARVDGLDVVKDAARLRYRIGLAGQYAAVDDTLTGRDNLVIFGRLSHLSRKVARARANELLESHALAHAADRPVHTYSGGMRRRLDLIASLIVVPPVLFLDEPTTGLDPRSRTQIWDTVRELAMTGTTVLLTTQYLEEADRLADRIAVIDMGRTVASGTPPELKATIGNRLDAVVADEAAIPAASEVLARLGDGEPHVDRAERRVSVSVADDAVTLTTAMYALDRAGVTAEDLALRRPTLDEVFFRLTDGSAPGSPSASPAVKDMV